jgi:mannitol operon transcriptional antiterminator
MIKVDHMDSRKDILLNDLITNRTVDVEEFLKSHAISFRTLQNDIAFLNSEMDANVLELHNAKVIVNDLGVLMDRLENRKREVTPYSYKMAREERLLIESLLILCSEGYVTASKLGKYLYVSRNTVITDMNFLKSKLQEHHLELAPKTNKGYEISGDEVFIRRRFYDIIMNSWGTFNDKYRKIIAETIEPDKDFFNVKETLIVFFDKNKIVLGDPVFAAFYLCAVFKLMRLRNGHVISKGEGGDGTRHPALQELMSELLYDGRWRTEGELGDFIHLVHYLNLDGLIQENYHADEQMVISSFVWEVCKELDVLEELEYESYRNLCAHIISSVDSIKKGVTSQINPILSDLKALYPDIFDAINKHISVLMKIANRALDENDISYIAMHVAVIVETNHAIDTRLRVVLVCPNGRCMSEFLKSRLLLYFSIDIIDTIPAYKLNAQAQNKIDLIISTVPLDSPKFPVVVVSQILSPGDLVRIRKCIRSIRKNFYKIEMHQNIENYVKGYQDIMDKNADSGELEKLNSRYGETKPSFFYSHITEKQILLDFETKSWQEAIRMSGELLRRDGYVNENYIEKMVELVEGNGPYILFMPGFALAHASPDDGASKLGVSLVRLKRPILFEGSDIPIRYVVCISITDKDSHISLMYQIYKCLTYEELFDNLSKCSTQTQIIELLRAFELSQTQK